MATPPVDNESTRSSSPGAYSVPSQTFASGSRPAQLQRHDSHSSRDPSIVSSFRSAALSSSWAEQRQEPSSWVQRKLQIHQSRGDDDYDDVSGLDPSLYDGEEDDYGPDEEEEAEVHESRFFQPAFLSEAALQLRDRVERRRQTKAGISWQDSFTGRDIVTTIQSFLPSYTRESPNDRRFALLMAQSLQNQLWFVEVDWDIKPLRDSPEDVFRFMGEMEGMGAGDGINSELPSGLMTMATRCYSPSCPQDSRCYASRCPFRQMPSSFIYMPDPSPTPEASTIHGEEPSDWTGQVDGRILQELTDEQYHRQAIIRQAIQQEVQYSADLTAMEDLYINALRNAQPPIIPHYRLEKFIHEVFSNEAEIREASGRLLDHFTIRERESAQPGLIPFVGDIFLQAAADFRSIYPEYTGNLPHAENVLRQEMEDNADFRFFCDRIVRENDGRRHIKYLITRPSDQLQRTYPAVLESILAITDPTEPDHDFLIEAVSSIQTLSAISQLKLFHASQGRGPAGKKQWHDLVPEDVRKDIPPKEQKRQMQIWELIQGEMEYVADLETMDTLFVDKLRMAENGPIVERSRVEIFLDDAFHNYRSLLEVHQNLLENLQARQLEQHPQVGAIGDLLLDAALNWQDAYMEYVTHYPIAKAKVQEEEMKNTKFAAFLKECLKDPQSHRQDIYHFINRPIPRLLRYNLLLADILKSLRESGLPEDHPDIETIPQVIDLIKDLGRATQKGVAVNESKVELWTYQHSLDGSRFGVRVVRDLDLLNPMRELIHRGRVFRQPEGPMSSWAELTVLLFDNYLVLVKPEKHRSSRREERQERYIINRRPIPLELLSIGQFGDAPRARRDRSRLMGGGGSSHEPESGADPESNKVWPFSISFIGQGQLGGQYTLWSDSYASRAEWQEKLQHAKVLRTEVNDANKVFEMTPLTTVDGRTLVAIGCEEGVWIGLRNDPHSLRKVLHVKSVTNIAVLEEFGIFLVLQDRSLLAYHLEALVPTASSPQVRAAPQRLSPGKDISFFSVGRLSGRTLVLYMKKKGMDSLFRVLEPISGRNAEDAARQRRPFGNFLGQRTEWFRLYKDFFIPTDALGVHWLKAKLAVVCAKGFEIMDLTEHGEPNRDMQAIEWEGRPDSVAFHPPYVLLVSAPFMEIRHIDTGKLLQIYTGTDIHLTWDGTGGMLHPPQDNPGPKGYGDETASQEPRIHICQRPDDPRRAKGITHGVGQHVFELTPTLALNNPLLNPIHTHDSNYFPPAPMIRSDMRSDNMSDRRVSYTHG
ncbi:Dbl homology domain-containing protein [Kockovaella imperatae]|uniref:Dbl homology domain-containing protein n=1 Tax=Kockovaella imperatae TaxID=4999 RepID=A0A1Y1UH67_9TREE|nr:Dbl homology domain-containing protein [Kockovaella imperatae]ORX37372.1 Dbl homology domain-containing protein [Kockovaella imperatae]